jgi:hypothetical protein
VYSTCIHCHRSLGGNELIEHFPVGRTLAFDGAKGRLWVVCRKCRRWNLTPLEERWEAIEESEKAFRDSPMKASTDNIAVARVGDGVELIRIGKPARRELASWRYASNVVRRWWTRGLPLATASTLGVVAQMSLNASSGGELRSWLMMVAGVAAFAGTRGLIEKKATSARLAMPDGKVTPVWMESAEGMDLTTTGGRWGLRWKVNAPPVAGAQALPLLRGVLTIANFSGGRTATVNDAVQLLHRYDSPDDFVRKLARASDKTGLRRIGMIPPAARIALEMALHDEAESRALDGELELLRAEWEAAEEIAGIADGMFLSPGLTAKLESLRLEDRK